MLTEVPFLALVGDGDDGQLPDSSPKDSMAFKLRVITSALLEIPTRNKKLKEVTFIPQKKCQKGDKIDVKMKVNFIPSTPVGVPVIGKTMFGFE